ncbi:hypothetical protein A0J61_08490 [Choanephora cucurbitarum]|uniref:UBZ4-type domain-containing protein n=1 Tax=Choanephora cucurbitarum TaxID=101091 RepID=A0A1C7N2Z3_9FUNG|nr:hypothetical protein A0J61_08490 [Choanephora cucurbitarum]
MAWQPNESHTTPSLKRIRDRQDDKEPKKKSISLSKTRSHSHCKKEDTQLTIPIQVKDEPFEDKSSVHMKEEISVEDIKWETEQGQIKHEPSETILIDEYHCPICNQDLTAQKSSYLRQRHVDQCIDRTETPPPSEPLSCPFCAKDLTRLTIERRQVHLNQCLDETDSQQTEQATVAGQPDPFLTRLDLCPVCHEDGPFQGQRLKQKIKHMKQCAKQNRVSTHDLLQKLKWIGWAHPLETPVAPPKLEHQTVIYLDKPDEDDFSDRVIVSKANLALLTKRTKDQKRQEDQLDEELQMALAVSKSIQPRRTRQATDLNVANVWSMEESRKHAIQKLDAVLFPSEQDRLDQYRQAEREMSLGSICPSQLACCQDRYFWKLASLSQSNGYTSNFLHNKGV